MQAIIFDMNGVIINDERHHQQSWRVLSAKYDGTMREPTEEEFKQHVFGRTEKATLTYLLGREPGPEEFAALSDERVRIVISIFEQNKQFADGLPELLVQLREDHIPLGIATSSRPNYVDYVLDMPVVEEEPLRSFFQAVVTAEDITRSKPDPEIYLKAASNLSVEPRSCLVFEDAISGIKAAKAAEMTVIGLASTHAPSELGEADVVISSFRDIRSLDLPRLVAERSIMSSGRLERK